MKLHGLSLKRDKEVKMLSDIESWASIIELILSFSAGFIVCKFTIKNNKQNNKNSSIFHVGDTNQSNNSEQ
jgi:hypothetical protein